MKVTREYDPSFTVLTVELDPGEQIKAEPGAMAWQQGVEMKTGMGGGGFLRSLTRMLGSESFFVNTFTAGSDGGMVSIAPSMPGDIQSFDVSPGRNIFLQGDAFLGSTVNVQPDTKFQGFRGFFSGENVFFLRAYTDRDPGTVYYNSFGAIKELAVEPDKELVVDTGHLVAFSDDVTYSIGKVGGLGSLLVGGEGLVMKFRGNGTVWVQTRTIKSTASKLIPFMPSK